MTLGIALYRWLLGLGQGAVGSFLRWWQVLFIGAQLGVLALSPASYGRESRGIVLRQIYHAAGPGLPGFTVVTAFAYGLSSFALDAVVRVLVLELIPLVAALYIAVEYTIPGGSELYKLRRAGAFERLRERGLDPLGREMLPRVLAGVFAVLLLAAVSCTVSLVLAYMAVHGFTTAGLASYNRAVGHIFNPVVTLIFGFKTVLFAIAVALLPVANALRDLPQRLSRTSVELQGLMQMFLLMLLIEIASLMGNYY